MKNLYVNARYLIVPLFTIVTVFWNIDNVDAPNYGIGYFSLIVLYLIDARY
jgi:hypothetical protein